MNTMKWLVRREFWEHKGGFFWAPVVVACIAILFAIASTVIGGGFVDNHAAHINSEIADEPQALGAVADGLLMAGMALMSAVLSFAPSPLVRSARSARSACCSNARRLAAPAVALPWPNCTPWPRSCAACVPVGPTTSPHSFRTRGLSIVGSMT